MKPRVFASLLFVLFVLLGGLAAGRAHAAQPSACSPCAYTVSPSGTGVHSLAYVLANLVQSGDTVVLADGVYRVGELRVAPSHVVVKAAHGWNHATPRVWLDGS